MELNKQGIVVVSSYEVEYVVASHTACQALWIDMLFEELNNSEVLKTKFLVDNKSIIDIENHPISHRMSNYIERTYHFLRDQIDKEKLKNEYCKTELQLAYILMKPLKKVGSKVSRD